jgi:hypothetical protein
VPFNSCHDLAADTRYVFLDYLVGDLVLRMAQSRPPVPVGLLASERTASPKTNRPEENVVENGLISRIVDVPQEAIHSYNVNFYGTGNLISHRFIWR